MEDASPLSPSSTTSHTSTDFLLHNNQEETARWLQLRRSLLGEKKFAKVMDEISEAEWVQSRTESFKTLLDCCSNFHGGPTGEMWNTIIGAVKNHFGPQHDLLSMISTHQENLWATCSLVTVTSLSEDTSVVNKDDTELQESASMPSSSHKSYGSVHLIEPSRKDGRRVCMHHFNWKWLIVYVPLLLALVVVTTLAITLAEGKPETTKRVETLEGTTVYLDTQKNLWYEGWKVSDCSSTNTLREDEASTIQLIGSNNIVYYEETVQKDEFEGYQSSTVFKTLNGPLYLLDGSIVEYEFCVSTNETRPGRRPHDSFSEFLIFNNLQSYTNFINHPGHLEEEAAIFRQKTPLAGVGKTPSCTTIMFNVSEAGFYFTIYKLPPHIELHYRTNIHIVYLNYTQYVAKQEAECKITQGGSCTIKIPENVLSTEDYTILAYVPLQANLAQNSTRMCVTPKQSVMVSVVPGVVSGCVLLLVLVVIVCQFISFLSNVKRRNGYFWIKPMNTNQGG